MQIESRYKHNLFPSYLFELNYTDYDSTTFKQVIYDHIKADTGSLTLSDHHIHTDERMGNFVQDVLKVSQEVMHTMGYFPQDLEISGMWGVHQKRGGVHRQHMHPNNWMCGVFYVDAFEGDTITFHDPRLRAGAIQPKTYKYNEYNTSVNIMNAAPGRMYIFPAWFEHSVDDVPHDNTRISLAWNIRIPRDLGCGYGCTNG